MAELLDDMQVYLAAYTPTLSLTAATNFFGGLMKDSPDDAIGIFEYGTESPEYVFGAANSLPAIAHPGLQVISRNTSYSAGRNKIEAVVRALEKICNQSINGTYYERVVRAHEPRFLHRDQRLRVFHVCNLSVDRTPS